MTRGNTDLTSPVQTTTVEPFDTDRPGTAAHTGATHGRDDEEQAMAEPDSAPETSSSEGASAEDVKRKFKEALDRKNQNHARTNDHLDGRSKASATHGNASHKREFRRKSG